MAIKSISHKGLRQLFELGQSAKVGASMKRAAIDIMDHLDAITSLQDCVGVRHFHQLSGARKGVYAMHVTGNHRITFKWDGEHVYRVNLEDYH